MFFGCTAAKITEPDRSGLEQLLLSTAVDNALDDVELPELQGVRVFVDDTFLVAYDKPYVLGTIRAVLNENGALLPTAREDAEIIVEPRSGALGIDSSDSILGVPAIPIVVPAGGTFSTPEFVLWGSKKANAVTKIALLAYNNDGSNVFSTGPLVGKAYFHQYKLLLLLNLNYTDVPERERY